MVYEMFVKGSTGKCIVDRFIGTYDTLDKAKYHAQELCKLLRNDLGVGLGKLRIEIRNSETYRNDIILSEV